MANLVNIAAIKAAVDGAEKLTAAQLEFAKDRIMMGTERKTMFVSEESKKVRHMPHIIDGKSLSRLVWCVSSKLLPRKFKFSIRHCTVPLYF